MSVFILTQHTDSIARSLFYAHVIAMQLFQYSILQNQRYDLNK